jgi:hypothetical protein
MAFTLLGFEVGLEAIAQLRQKLGDSLVADVMPQTGEGLRQVPCALVSPEQRRHRITPGGKIDEPQVILEQREIGASRHAITLHPKPCDFGGKRK